MLRRLKAEEIESAFQSWISELIKKTGSDLIAVDGKIARSSFKTKGSKNALHCVKDCSCQIRLVLVQTAVNEKPNQITTIPELLNLLDIEQSITTLDAMGTQEKIAQQIIQQKTDFILALKGNHSGMQAE